MKDLKNGGRMKEERERKVEKMKREKEKLRMRTEQRKENGWIKGGKGGKSESRSEKDWKNYL